MHNENHPLRQLIITQYQRGKALGPTLKVDLDRPCPAEAEKLSPIAAGAFLIGAQEAIMKDRRNDVVAGEGDQRDAKSTFGCLIGAEAQKRLVPVLLGLGERDRAAVVFATPDPDDASAWIRNISGVVAVTRLVHAVTMLGGKPEFMPSHDDIENKADLAVPFEAKRGLFLQVKSDAGTRGIRTFPALKRRTNPDPELRHCSGEEKRISRQLHKGVQRLNRDLGLQYDGLVVVVGTQGLSLHQLDTPDGLIRKDVRSLLTRVQTKTAA